VFVYNVAGQLIAEYTSGTPAAGDTSYLTTDHLGSTRLVTDSGGNVKARYDYLPFGEEIGANIGSRSTVVGYGGTDSTKQKFTQKERDGESGLDYFLARYYSSAQGRFTSPDPLMASGFANEPQSWNRFSYTVNNPLKYTDPSGLIWGSVTQNGQSQYIWYENEEEMEKAGATAVQFDSAFRFIYTAGPGEHEGKFILLDQNRNHWEAFETREQAFYGTHGEVGDNSTAASQAFELTAYETGGRVVAGLVGKVVSALFGRVAAEATGVSTEGVAYEFKFVNRHLAGTSEAAKEVAKGGAHVFKDLSTLSRVETEIFARGVPTGTTRGFARFGVRFSEPIGERIGNDGTRTALNYGEMKLRENGLYHIIPRTGPSK